MVAVEILGGILQFTVHRLVQVLKDRDPERFGVFEMCIDFFDEDSQALRTEPKFFRSLFFRPSFFEHEAGFARKHLGSAGWVTVTVVLHEAEGIAEPEDGFLQVPVRDVRKHRVSGYRAI